MSNILAQIPDEVLATLVGLIGAFIGYGIREFRNRARPFFQVLMIGGGTRRLADTITLPEATCKNLEAAGGPLRTETIAGSTTLGDLNSFCSEAQDLLDGWERLESLFDLIGKAADQAEILVILPRLLSLNLVERWIIAFAVSDKLAIPKAEAAIDVVPIYPTEQRNGANWLAFPGMTFVFGFNLKDSGFSAKMQPFFALIRASDVGEIKQTFSQIRNLMAAERNRAAELIHPLKERLNESSRWSFRIYLANLSNSPILIGKKGQLTVSERFSGKPFKEQVYLVLHLENHTLSDAVTPLVIRPGEDATFSFITAKKQEQMARGRALREVFEKGGGSLKIELHLQRVGFFKQQTFRSSAVPFEESGSPGAVAQD